MKAIIRGGNQEEGREFYLELHGVEMDKPVLADSVIYLEITCSRYGWIKDPEQVISKIAKAINSIKEGGKE